MGKRGMKPLGKVNTKWSNSFAYAIGLLVADGSLSKDRRHIVFVSKDREQVLNFCRALNINQIYSTYKGGKNTYAYRVQIGDVLFYNFLSKIGLTPNKSLSIKKVKIPEKYFFHFVRGCFDGDGSVYSYFDPRWRKNFMFYTSFTSGSKFFIS